MKPEPKVPRYTAYPPRRQPRPDSATVGAAAIAWSIAFLLLIYWLAPLAVAHR